MKEFEQFDVSEELGLAETAKQPSEVRNRPEGEADDEEIDNKQPFDPEFRQELTSRLSVDMEQFHNTIPPHWIVKRERIHHRFVGELAAQGFTAKEISERTGFRQTTISNLLRQSWMQQFITRRMASGSDEVLMELQGEALAAARRLVSISNDTSVNAETRRKANNDILDRVYGKPNQPMTHTQVDPTQLSDAELMELAAKQRHN